MAAAREGGGEGIEEAICDKWSKPPLGHPDEDVGSARLEAGIWMG